MKRISLSLLLLVLLPFFGLNAATAEDAAPAADATAAAPASPAEPAEEVAPAATPLDNLDFASGEIVSFDAASGKLDVKVYLDGTGDAKEQTISLTVGDGTEITSGENDLKSDALKTGAEIDVEYDTTNKKATYVFIY